MAHAQKPDLVFQRNGRVHLYRRGCQFSGLLAAEVCASAVVMLDRPRSDTVEGCWLPTPLASFPFTSPPVRRRVPSDSVSTLPGVFRGGKGGLCVGLITLPHSCADCLEVWGPQPAGTLRACPGL